MRIEVGVSDPEGSWSRLGYEVRGEPLHADSASCRPSLLFERKRVPKAKRGRDRRAQDCKIVGRQPSRAGTDPRALGGTCCRGGAVRSRKDARLRVRRKASGPLPAPVAMRSEGHREDLLQRASVASLNASGRRSRKDRQRARPRCALLLGERGRGRGHRDRDEETSRPHDGNRYRRAPGGLTTGCS